MSAEFRLLVIGRGVIGMAPAMDEGDGFRLLCQARRERGVDAVRNDGQADSGVVAARKSEKPIELGGIGYCIVVPPPEA
jgi:hypothetical protein